MSYHSVAAVNLKRITDNNKKTTTNKIKMQKTTKAAIDEREGPINPSSFCAFTNAGHFYHLLYACRSG